MSPCTYEHFGFNFCAMSDPNTDRCFPGLEEDGGVLELTLTLVHSHPSLSRAAGILCSSLAAQG